MILVYDCPMSQKGMISIIEDCTTIQGPIVPIQELSERCEASPTGMPMPLIPRSPSPRMRSPSVTTAILTSSDGQLRTRALRSPLQHAQGTVSAYVAASHMWVVGSAMSMKNAMGSLCVFVVMPNLGSRQLRLLSRPARCCAASYNQLWRVRAAHLVFDANVKALRPLQKGRPLLAGITDCRGVDDWQQLGEVLRQKSKESILILLSQNC